MVARNHFQKNIGCTLLSKHESVCWILDFMNAFIWECCGFCLSKSRGVQHLNMIFIRAWYIQTPQQPPPPGVAAIADDDVVYGDSED